MCDLFSVESLWYAWVFSFNPLSCFMAPPVRDKPRCLKRRMLKVGGQINCSSCPRSGTAFESRLRSVEPFSDQWRLATVRRRWRSLQLAFAVIKVHDQKKERKPTKTPCCWRCGPMISGRVIWSGKN